MNKFSHIVADLEARKIQLEAAQKRFDPNTFSIKDKKERIGQVELDDFVFLDQYFPDIFTIPFAAIHDEFSYIFKKRNREIHLLLGPRRWSKSEMLRCLRIKKMVFGHFRHGLRVGENIEDAENEIAQCRLELELNPRLNFDFGNLLDMRVKSSHSIRLKNGITFRPLSPNVKGRGITPEPDYVEVDDFEDDESAANPERSKKKLSWLLKELYPGISKRGVILWLGNNLSLDSACNQFLEALEKDAKKKFFAHVFKAIIHDQDGNPISTWPQAWSVEELLELKSDIGTAAFEAEMQQNPMRPGDKFKPEWFRSIELSEIEKDKSKRRVGIFQDPSYGESDSSSYKATIVMSTDGKHYDIIDCWLRQASVKSMCHGYYELRNKWRDWNIVFKRMEDIMSHKMLFRDYDEVAEARNEVRDITGIGNDEFFKVPKDIRIETLSMPLETGKIRFVTEGGQMSQDMKRLQEQFLNYPKKPNDGPDATASCYKLLTRFYNSADRPAYKSIAKRLHIWR